MKYNGIVSVGNFVVVFFAVLLVSILAFLVLYAPAYAALTGGVKITGVVKNGTANPSDFTLQIKSGNSTVSASGNVIVLNGLIAGDTYTITKTEGPSGYSVVWSGDCSAQGTVTILPSIMKNCTATYVLGPVGALRVNTVIKGGTAVAADFTVHIKKSGESDTGNPSGSGSTITFSDLLPGVYTVIQSTPLAGYSVTFGGGCNSQGNITVVGNSTATCTITNTFSSGSGGGSGGGEVRPDRVVPPRPSR